MAQQTINIGSNVNSGGGDAIRTAFKKINENFTELYADITALEDGNLTTDIKGSVFADDSTLIVDAVNGIVTADVTGNVTGDVTGDLKGSVFADDSTLVINGANGEIPGYVSVATLQSVVAASADFADFQTRIAAL